MPQLHYHAKISVQRGDMYLVRHNQCCVQGNQGGCTHVSYSWKSPPFSPETYLPLTSQPLPQLSSLWGEGVFTAHSHSHSSISKYSFCSSLPTHSTGTCSSRQDWSPPNCRGSVTQCLAQEAVKTIWSCRLDDVEIHNCREGIFHDGPVVKTLPSNAGGVGSIPGQGAKNLTCLVARKPKHKNRSNTVTNSIKTLKMVHIKKKKKF